MKRYFLNKKTYSHFNRFQILRLCDSDKQSQYLHHQDVITVNAVNCFVCFFIQLSGELHQDPPPVRHPLSLQRQKCKMFRNGRKKGRRDISTDSKNLRSLHHLAIVEILIWVWESCELSGTAIQVDVAGTKDWEETHFRLPRVSCREIQSDSTSL